MSGTVFDVAIHDICDSIFHKDINKNKCFLTFARQTSDESVFICYIAKTASKRMGGFLHEIFIT